MQRRCGPPGDAAEPRFELAALNGFLAELAPPALSSLPGDALSRLDATMQCRVAAMVEHASAQRGRSPPSWTADVPPLEVPDMAAPLRSLRLHLPKASPVAFRRRNLFVDA